MTPGFIEFPSFPLVKYLLKSFPYEWPELKHSGMQEILLQNPGRYVSLREIPS